MFQILYTPRKRKVKNKNRRILNGVNISRPHTSTLYGDEDFFNQYGKIGDIQDICEFLYKEMDCIVFYYNKKLDKYEGRFSIDDYLSRKSKWTINSIKKSPLPKSLMEELLVYEKSHKNRKNFCSMLEKKLDIIEEANKKKSYINTIKEHRKNSKRVLDVYEKKLKVSILCNENNNELHAISKNELEGIKDVYKNDTRQYKNANE